MQIKTDNHSTHLNYISICSSSALLRCVAHCSDIITPILVDNWKKMDCICIHKACSLEVKVLQGFLYRELGDALPESLVFILSESKMIPMSSEESQAYVRICYVQVCKHTYSISAQSLNSASVSQE